MDKKKGRIVFWKGTNILQISSHGLSWIKKKKTDDSIALVSGFLWRDGLFCIQWTLSRIKKQTAVYAFLFDALSSKSVLFNLPYC